MITINDLFSLLEILEYEKVTSNRFFKYFNKGTVNECKIEVDFEKHKFTYPEELTIHRNTTTNFSSNENFVIFEVVNRLLEIGYLPKQIELEFSMSIGRGKEKITAWSDVLIKDNEGRYYAIIEAKTSGKEFDSAWKKTINENGYQLFSYVDQLRTSESIPYGILYTSDIFENSIIRNYHIISFKDNIEFLNKIDEKNDKNLYLNSSDSEELFRIWNEVYDQTYSTAGMFEENATPFEISEMRLTVDDIYNNPLDTDGLINKFRKILRKYNVSGGENAFDRLLNLLLAKIVDEKQSLNTKKPLEFYWRGIAFDEKKALVDRLQRLYRDGMRDYLKEDVTYIDTRDVDRAFSLFINDKDATKDLIQNYFDQLKFYTDNFFSFIDVYNESLFNQNFEILSEIVEIFQDVSLTNSKQHQFLGDLFEKLLDQGIKQSEGQFFTPLPIVKFIISSLPIDEIIKSGKVPKVIDYACGSGHFLTEYASMLKKYVVSEKNISEYHKNIYGLEKESRLAKVSKVSALMYGAVETQIYFQDALLETEEIANGTYDILIANPPYSVTGFLDTLDEKSKKDYELFKVVNNSSTNKAIEAFFVEKMKKLLKPGGIAGIILPSSILQKNESIFINTRKMIIESFEIIAIFEAGSGTFGKTGTNTVTLFLRKRLSELDLYDHYKNRVDAWYDEKDKYDELFGDGHKLRVFANILGLSLEDILKNNKYKEKLIYYLISDHQENDVIIIKTPATGKELKQFLGYEWSNRKGSEGIKYLNGELSKINNDLYNHDNFYDNTKINFIIRNNFNNKDKVEHENVQYARLSELISWEDQNLNLGINTYKRQTILLSENEQLVSLKDNKIFEMNIGKRVKDEELVKGGKLPVYSANVFKPFGYINKNIIEDFTKPSIIWGIDGDWQVNYIKENTPFYPTDHIGYLRINSEEIKPRYLVELIKMQGETFGFSRTNRASMHKMKRMQLVIPSLDVQEKIINELEILDYKQEKILEKINEFNDNILSIVSNIKGANKKLSEVTTEIFAGGDAPSDKSFVPTDKYMYPIYSNGEKEDGLYGWSILPKVFEEAVTISARGTIGYIKMREPNFTPIVRLITAIPDKTKIKTKMLEIALKNADFFSSGTTTQQLTVPMVTNIILKFPSNLEEQEKIINEVVRIEENIDELEKEFLKLENMKKNLYRK
ncbi:N-6 DNA methylase [Macrococcoides canis]|uniref:N-6 DNA methylase n=1 Tax=Macrococcoides canis TaxID=1855823 RepID=UPI0022B87D91|nr:N-6 DNA methylase [Macrococcus canis]WBF52865.1 N-6 DNA methylase [Macrococcus canis]